MYHIIHDWRLILWNSLFINCLLLSDSLRVVPQGATWLHWGANCSGASSDCRILLDLQLEQLLAQGVGCRGDQLLPSLIRMILFPLVSVRGGQLIVGVLQTQFILSLGTKAVAGIEQTKLLQGHKALQLITAILLRFGARHVRLLYLILTLTLSLSLTLASRQTTDGAGALLIETSVVGIIALAVIVVASAVVIVTQLSIAPAQNLNATFTLLLLLLELLTAGAAAAGAAFA